MSVASARYRCCVTTCVSLGYTPLNPPTEIVPVRDAPKPFRSTTYVTVPRPRPLEPEMIRSHDGWSVAAVHSRLESTGATVTLNVPPVPDTVRFGGEGQYRHVDGDPACRTVSRDAAANAGPLMVIEASRDAAAAFASTTYDTLPDPVPVAPDVMRTHDALLVDCQAHDGEDVCTASTRAPPAGSTLATLSPSETLHDCGAVVPLLPRLAEKVPWSLEKGV